MRGTWRDTFIGLALLAVVLAGCGAKHATDTTAVTDANVDSSEPSTTPTTLTLGDQCILLSKQEKDVRAAEADITRQLAAARASDPHGTTAGALATQRMQLQHELADLEELLTRFQAANGQTACPPGSN
jgi:hypothetical protein